MSSFTARTLLSQCAKTRFRAVAASTNNMQHRTWRIQQTVRTMATEQPQGQGRPLGALAHHTEKKQWKDLSTPEKGSQDYRYWTRGTILPTLMCLNKETDRLLYFRHLRP